MSGRSIAVQILIAVFVIAILLAILGFTVLLNAAERRIPVQYAQKVQGRRSVGGRSTYIPKGEYCKRYACYFCILTYVYATDYRIIFRLPDRCNNDRRKDYGNVKLKLLV